MGWVNRKVTYKLYPTHHQSVALEKQRELHRQLYNAALESRIDAYQRCGVSIGFYQQCRELTELRKVDPAYCGLHAQSSQITLKRLDLAFEHFFRRVKAKAARVGFPRFRGRDRFDGFGFKSHGDGWRLSLDDGLRLRIKDVGSIRLRGKSRFEGSPKTMELRLKNGCWYASVTFELLALPKRDAGHTALGLDWGLKHFATVVSDDGAVQQIKPAKVLARNLAKLRSAQKVLSRRKKGSQNRKKQKQIVGRIHQKVANSRLDFLHKTSSELIQRAGLVAFEILNVKSMSSNGGERKKGLNRNILDSSPAAFLNMLKYKAEEAGISVVEVPTRSVKPSQTCSECGHQAKKTLQQRTHDCGQCGYIADRDENAARVALNWALFGRASGQELARCGGVPLGSPMKQETPSVASAQVA